MRTVVLVLAVACGLFGAPPDGQFEDLSRKAAAAREANRPADAIGLYRRAVALRPDWTEGLWFIGALSYEAGRFSEARDALRRFVALDPSAGAPWALLGLSEFKTREYTRSLLHLQRALAAGIDREGMAWAARYHAAALLARFERFEEAAAALQPFAAAGRRTGSVLDLFGITALRLPVLPDELMPARRELVRLAGAAAFEMAATHNPEAAQAFAILLEKYPNEPNVHLAHAAFLLAGDRRRGIEELGRELEIAPENVAALTRLAFELLEDDQPGPARDAAEKAAALSPDEFTTRFALGRALLAHGEVAKAIAELEASKRLAPHSPGVRWTLASAYARAGQPEEAARERAEFERLEKTKP